MLSHFTDAKPGSRHGYIVNRGVGSRVKKKFLTVRKEHCGCERKRELKTARSYDTSA